VNQRAFPLSHVPVPVHALPLARELAALYRISDYVDEQEVWGTLTASLASLQHTALRDEQRIH